MVIVVGVDIADVVVAGARDSLQVNVFGKRLEKELLPPFPFISFRREEMEALCFPFVSFHPRNTPGGYVE